MVDDNNKYAYVWLVMLGDRYVPGAMVSAYSFKHWQTAKKIDLVCITAEVSKQGIETLKKLFDRVIETTALEHDVLPLPTAKQNRMYSKWMRKSFTKWKCLQLVDYDKIAFFDADTVALRDMSYLFDLECPAGTFSNPWAKPLPDGKIENYYLVGNDYPKTGDKIKPSQVRSGLERRGFVAVATTMVLKPSADDYKLFVEMLGDEPFGYKGCFSSSDEQAIAKFYSVVKKATWTNIHQEANFIPWKKDWLQPGAIPHVLHYQNEPKSWETKRSTHHDLAIFYEFAEALNIDVIPKNLFDDTPEECAICQMFRGESNKHKNLDCPLIKSG